MVEFDKTLDDLAALSQYILSHQDAMKRTRWVGLILWAIMPFVLVLFMVLVMGLSMEALLWPPITIFVLIMIGYCIYNAQKYAILSRFIRNSIKRIAKKNDYSRELGPNEITIGPDGLHRKNRYSEDKTSWEGIIRIVQTKNHIFFFVTDVAGYILPMRAFKTQKEKEDFIRKANEFWKRSR